MFLFCLVFAMSLCASVYMCFVVTCWERADLLPLVCGVYCEFVTFPSVSWIRYKGWNPGLGAHYNYKCMLWRASQRGLIFRVCLESRDIIVDFISVLL